MENNENKPKLFQDDGYPILLEVPGTDSVRLDKESEKRLIRDASMGGMRFKRIATRSDYNMATIVAAKDPEHRERKEKAAQALLDAIFGDQA